MTELNKSVNLFCMKQTEKKVLIAVTLNGKPHYWLKQGYGNTEDINRAHKYKHSEAVELVARARVGVELIPA